MECPHCGRPTASCSCVEGQQRHRQQQAPSSVQASQPPPGTSPRRHASGPANTQTAPSSQPRPAGSARQQAPWPTAPPGAGPSSNLSLRPPSATSARQQTSGPTAAHGTDPSNTPPTRALPVRSNVRQAPGLTAAHRAGLFGRLYAQALPGSSAGHQTSHPAASHVNTPSQMSAIGSTQPRNTPPAASRGHRGSPFPEAGPSGRQAAHPAATSRIGRGSQSSDPGPFRQAIVNSAAASGTGVLMFDIVQDLAVRTRRAEQSIATLELFLENTAADHNSQVASRYPRMEPASDLPQSAVWSVTGYGANWEAPTTSVECK
jgi:hypothetical protein